MVAPTCPALRTVQDIEALLEATLFEFDDPPAPPQAVRPKGSGTGAGTPFSLRR